MYSPDFSRARWRKADVSGDAGCVEIAHASGAVGIRDSKNRERGSILVVSGRAWATFMQDARTGKFDLDTLAS